MDLDNPVVKLCQEGMRAEAEGRRADARTLFEQAWDASRDDYDACVAAHYVARHQDEPTDVLRWNQEALDLAHAVGDERVATLYPSLYVGVGLARERLGDSAGARDALLEAQRHVAVLPEDDYGTMLRGAIKDGLRRLGG
ncbi:hypothetical protein [Micromonospora sp. URMC 103]|uniref:hypothetical protein n=1 Tax=Micromonospora sp. URMC 103 TaxID=3423406 RepID=UPI003F1CEBBC